MRKLPPLGSWMPACHSTTEQGDCEVSLGCQWGISCAGVQLSTAACSAGVLCMRNTGKAWEVASMRPGSREEVTVQTLLSWFPERSLQEESQLRRSCGEMGEAK